MALGLIKQKDGNYAPKPVDKESAPRSAAATSSPEVQAALIGLTIGG